MNIIAVDDERDALEALKQAILSSASDVNVSCFSTAVEAIRYAQSHRVDVAFLDIQLREMDGLMLAKILKEIYAETNVIFVTGHSEYAPRAFSLHASGYVMKPVNPANVRMELAHLRNPVPFANTGIRIQCFGNFEVFVDGAPISFALSKSKETLAYLIDRRGAGVTKKEIATVVLDCDDYTRSIQSYTHKIIAEMFRALKAAQASGLVYHHRNLYAIDTNSCHCDFYQYLRGDAKAVNSYRGEYMLDYSWAEFTTAKLTVKT